MRKHSPCPRRPRPAHAAVSSKASVHIDETSSACGAPPSAMRPPVALTLEREEVISCIRKMTTSADFEGKGCFFGVNNHGVTRKGDRVPETPLLVKLTEPLWKESLSNLQSTGIFSCKAISIHADDPSVYVEMLADLRVSGSGGDGANGHPVTVRYWGLELADNEKGEGTGDPRAQALCNALTGTRHQWPYVYVYAQIAFAQPTETLQREPEIYGEKGRAAPTLTSSTADIKRFGAGLASGFLVKEKASSTMAATALTQVEEGADLDENRDDRGRLCFSRYDDSAAYKATNEIAAARTVSHHDAVTRKLAHLTKYEAPLTRSLSSAEAIDAVEHVDTRTAIARNSEHTRAVMSTSQESSRRSSRVQSLEASPTATSTAPPPAASCENSVGDDGGVYPIAFTLGASLADV